MIQNVRNEIIPYFIGVFIFTLFVETFQYCDLNTSNESERLSTILNLNTNHGNERFTLIFSYIPGKTYDIIVSVNEELMEEKWRVTDVYVKAKKEGKIENVGQLIFNFTQRTPIKQCDDGFHFHLTNNLSKNCVFYWKAPEESTTCVTLSIAAILRDQRSNQILGERIHTICGASGMPHETMQGDKPDVYNCELKVKPDPTKICNIGSTAIYRMTIENNWNHLNHWKDWPGRDGYVPKLTQFLGASHTSNFDIYHLGGMASDAVQHVCTNGTYTTLQKDFYKSGNDILTVILARSLEATPSSGKRSALIVVNSTYHLITFLSRLVPSPDWCTGISRFDICSDKCSWQDQVTVPLYPWDVGVYGGESYLSSRDGEARSPICPITSTWPKDNPFTKINGKFQNIGTVTFKLIQEYNKERNGICNVDNTVLQDEGYKPDMQQKQPKYSHQKTVEEKIRHCQLSEWSEWSVCSKPCGNGEKVRYRKVIKGLPEKCMSLPLKDVELCHNKCPQQSSIETCLLRLWTEWSQCNATCTHAGVIYRDRVFIDDEEKQQCSNYPEMRQVETCRLSSVRCDPPSACNEHVNHGELCDSANPTMRFYFNFITGTCQSFTYNGCHGGLNNFFDKHECESMCSRYPQQKANYRTKAPDKYSHRCNSPVRWGQDCRGKTPAYYWYFDNINQKCYQFFFAGCRGSANKFNRKKECEKLCLTQTDPDNVETSSEPDTCSYSEWSEWSTCSSDCPNTKIRTRTLNGPAVNCNEDLTQMKKCQSTSSCTTPTLKSGILNKCAYSSWSAWSACSVLCGKGIRERVRVKRTHNCVPEFPQFSHRETCYNDCVMV